jgi:ABC-2 type transport system permease protein
LAEGLHSAMVDGTAPGVRPVVVLLVWGAAAGALATRTTKLT